MAQAPQPPPTRSEYVFYIYVDPLRGDDTLASAQNPQPITTPSSPLKPLQLHPDAGDGLGSLDPLPIAGVLQHAPFAYKTLTAAVAYANQFLPVNGVFWSVTIGTTPSKIVSIRHLVICCLPGLYGPIDATRPRIDAQSGLPFNGETWPVVLKSYVSIQGTSALDTIFDARLMQTHILEVADPAEINGSHRESFIDSVTIRNARASSETFGSGAGVYVRSSLGEEGIGSTIQVTNCFITNNVVGIGVDSYTPQQPVPQYARIINNTIAWNAIGLWSGNTRLSAAQSINNLMLLNNVFDSVGLPGYIGGQSGFEGVSDNDTRVVQTGSGPVIPPQDYNAWEEAYLAFVRGVNLGVSAGSWPVTVPNSSLTAPRVNLTPWTKRPNGGRQGTLYINDTFWAALGIDHSPHDFRLAPMVTLNNVVSPGVQHPILTMNPLVSKGIVAGTPLGTFFPITMQGGQSLTAPPGLPPGSEGSSPVAHTRVDGWDYDAEGFGNPRVHHHPGYWLVPVTIDIGADEMGPLVIAGFINGTRILTPEGVPNAPGVNALSNHGAFYFFARMELNLPNGHARPETNFYDAKVLTDWYAGVQAVPALDADVGNYTTAALGVRPGGTTAERRRDYLNTSGGYEAFLRGLECDFTSHLAPDPHPFWGAAMGIPLNQSFWTDIYACNPWYDHDTPPPLPVTPLPRRDNPTLFHNVGGGSSTSWLGTFGGPMYVLDATLNPPGTFPQAARWTLAPTVTFGPYAPCTGASPTTFTVGLWGFGDTAAGCPDVVPFMGGQLVSAVRFNCERIVDGVSTTNLQTMLGIHAPQPIEEAVAAANRGTRLQPVVRPTVEEVRRIMRGELRRRS